MEPSFPDPELGYIVPAADAGIGPQTVTTFVEKPSVAQARTLIRDGALWNAFILAARGSTRTPERVGNTLARLPPAIADNAEPNIDSAAINLAINYQRAATANW